LLPDVALKALKGLVHPTGIKASSLPHRPSSTALTTGDRLEGPNQPTSR
jgi:hypothetical protein